MSNFSDLQTFEEIEMMEVIHSSNLKINKGESIRIYSWSPERGCLHVVKYTEDMEETEFWISCDTSWQICGGCNGEGKRLAEGLRGEAFTQSDLAEWEPDEVDCMMSGGYDVGCSDCSGSGKVKEFDTEDWPNKLKQAATDYWAEIAADEEMRRAEMGYR